MKAFGFVAVGLFVLVFAVFGGLFALLFWDWRIATVSLLAIPASIFMFFVADRFEQ